MVTAEVGANPDADGPLKFKYEEDDSGGFFLSYQHTLFLLRAFASNYLSIFFLLVFFLVFFLLVFFHLIP